jgi:hypothetical protein
MVISFKVGRIGRGAQKLPDTYIDNNNKKNKNKTQFLVSFLVFLTFARSLSYSQHEHPVSLAQHSLRFQFR